MLLRDALGNTVQPTLGNDRIRRCDCQVHERPPVTNALRKVSKVKKDRSKNRAADAAEGQLWPSPDYDAQVERLREAVGRKVFIVELVPTGTELAVSMPGQPVVLLDVLPFPRPDPARGLAPHLLLFDDGRGVNLGRIARVSVDRPFSPSRDQILYRDADALDGLLFAERRLSKRTIAERSRVLLGRLLGKALPVTALPTGRTKKGIGGKGGERGGG